MKAIKVLLSLAMVTSLAESAFSAVTITVSGVYDEQTVQANTVDRSATTTTGNQIGLEDFKSLVSTAHASGFGGVINFDSTAVNSNVSNNPTDFFTIRYGLSSEKSLTIRNTSPTTMNVVTNPATGINRMPVSGVNYLGKNGNVANGDHFDFTFEASAQVIAVGATLLSRDGSTGNAVGKVTFSDGTFVSHTFNQTAGIGTDDLFFGFRLTEAQQASGIYITNVLFDPADYRGLDDLAFVVAPEPGRAALVMLAVGAMFMRRRR